MSDCKTRRDNNASVYFESVAFGSRLLLRKNPPPRRFLSTFFLLGILLSIHPCRLGKVQFCILRVLSQSLLLARRGERRTMYRVTDSDLCCIGIVERRYRDDKYRGVIKSGEESTKFLHPPTIDER